MCSSLYKKGFFVRNFTRIKNEELHVAESYKSQQTDVDRPIKDVLAQLGGIARLPCRLSNPGAGTVRARFCIL